MIEADQLKVWFPIKRGFFRRTVGHVKAVDGIDVAVRAGQTLGVVGESGSGKTTLGLALMRLVPSEGRIAYLGSAINAHDAARHAAATQGTADRVPGPVWLAQPAHVDPADR